MLIVSVQFLFTFSVAPQILPFDFGEKSVNTGEFTSLMCSVHKGDLPINISWLHNNISVGYVEGVTVSKMGSKLSTIAIESVGEKHAGAFTCIAQNRAGKSSHKAILNVNGKIYICNWNICLQLWL